MRYSEVTEAALPAALHAKRLYHGTGSPQAAENILRVGLRPDMKTAYKGDLRPAKGHVYLTANLHLAVKHALGPTHRAYTHDGYVFVVDGKDLTDVDPDEDAIGEFLWLHTADGAFDPRYEADPEVDLRRQIWTFIMAHGRKNDLRESLILGPKRPGAWAALGKSLQPIIPDWMTIKLIEWGAEIAHNGAIRPSEGWRIARSDAAKLDGALTNFFEIAQRVR